MTYGLFQSTSPALGGIGAQAGIQSPCMGESEGSGCGYERAIFGHGGSVRTRNDWAGKGIGIRGPGIDETPLSESEALVAMRVGL